MRKEERKEGITKTMKKGSSNFPEVGLQCYHYLTVETARRLGVRPPNKGQTPWANGVHSRDARERN
jgi:hypothetical protein